MTIIKRNDGFVCIHCHQQVNKASKTCRNHCPYCFTSLHVDASVPGDRASSCGGIMLPFERIYSNGVCRIHFVCLDCKHTHRNKVAPDDNIAILDEKIQEYKIKTFMMF